MRFLDKFAVKNASDKGQSYLALKNATLKSGENPQRNNSNVWESPNPQTKPNNQEHYKKINVEDMFKVNPDNLPKPPENWRNKMVSAIGPEAAHATKNVADSPDIFHPKAVNMFMPTFGGQTATQTLPMQSTFFPQQAARPNRPQGPQNLSRNDKHPPGHGAFIPLQATRNNAKGLKEQNYRSEERKVTYKILVAHSNSQLTTNISFPKAIRTKPPPDKLSNTVADNDQTAPGPSRTRQSFVPPNPPKSRIAARFEKPTL